MSLLVRDLILPGTLLVTGLFVIGLLVGWMFRGARRRRCQALQQVTSQYAELAGVWRFPAEWTTKRERGKIPQRVADLSLALECCAVQLTAGIIPAEAWENAVSQLAKTQSAMAKSLELALSYPDMGGSEQALVSWGPDLAARTARLIASPQPELFWEMTQLLHAWQALEEWRKLLRAEARLRWLMALALIPAWNLTWFSPDLVAWWFTLVPKP